MVSRRRVRILPPRALEKIMEFVTEVPAAEAPKRQRAPRKARESAPEPVAASVEPVAASPKRQRTRSPRAVAVPEPQPEEQPPSTPPKRQRARAPKAAAAAAEPQPEESPPPPGLEPGAPVKMKRTRAKKPAEVVGPEPQQQQQQPQLPAVDANFMASLSGTLRCLQRDDRNTKLAALRIA